MEQTSAPGFVPTRSERFRMWLANVEKGHGFRHRPNSPVHWTPLRKPLSQCQVALVTTAGVHLTEQEPFDLLSEKGDWTYREIPGSVRTEDLAVSHDHYDHSDADRDVNCVFPIQRLRELQQEGTIARVAPRHFGFMGFIPDPLQLREKTAPEVARKLVEDGTDVALLTAG